jgi:iron complex outermembrane receptor protein
VPPAAAQDPLVEPPRTLKVDVVGTNIPRSEVETALPVQVITREEIDRSGATTLAEVMARVSANVLGFNDALSVDGIFNAGLASVNLRGLGDGSTLVLINGRRVANYAFSGAAVDVNQIPLSAVERVEILKDGASAIYGSDAMAGVVNVVLRSNFAGAEASVLGSVTERGGGDQWEGTVTLGIGDIAKDGYNVFVTASYQKDQSLHATQRSFASTGYRPELGLSRVAADHVPREYRKAGPAVQPDLRDRLRATGLAAHHGSVLARRRLRLRRRAHGDAPSGSRARGGLRPGRASNGFARAVRRARLQRQTG